MNVYMLTQLGYALSRHGSVLKGLSPQTLIGTKYDSPLGALDPSELSTETTTLLSPGQLNWLAHAGIPR
jgi:hypothetical protein